MKRLLSSGVFIVITGFILFMNGTLPVAAFGQKDVQGMYHIQTSLDSNYATTFELPKVIKKAINNGVWREITSPIPPTDIYISVNGEKRYAVDHQLNIYDRKTEKLLAKLPSFKATKQLSKDIKHLHKLHYGKRINWNEANNLLPRYSIFTVLDIDTGLSFQVQRRAGSHHADVQPLKKEDTKIMKKIYRGTWSWDRRAILVVSKEKKYAASMHGMPHGKGALKNGFPGHFCIHFQDSITHKSRKMDHAHAIMVKKAAGEWIDYTEKLTPPEIVDATVLSIHQHDWFILASILDDKNRLLLKEHIPFLEEIELVKRLSDIKDSKDFEAQLTYPITVKLYIHRDRTGTESREVTFHMFRSSLEEPWTLDLERLVKQL